MSPLSEWRGMGYPPSLSALSLTHTVYSNMIPCIDVNREVSPPLLSRISLQLLGLEHCVLQSLREEIWLHVVIQVLWSLCKIDHIAAVLNRDFFPVC